MNTKKFAVSLGGFLAVTAPIVAVISCGSTSHGENSNEKLAKQFNEKIKTNIVETKKNVAEIIEATKSEKDKNGLITPAALGIEDQLQAIGTVPQGNEHKLYVTGSTIDSVTVKSKIFFNKNTADEGIDTVTLELKTGKMTDDQTAQYNLNKIDNVQKTDNVTAEVARLPEKDKPVTAKELGIKEFAFEGVSESTVTMVSKEPSTEGKNAGTAIVNVTVKVGDSKTATKSKEITIFGFKESQLAKNTEAVKKAIDKINSAKNLEYPESMDGLKDGDKLVLDKIQNLPKEVKDLGDAVKFTFTNSFGAKRITATVSIGDGPFQTYTETIDPVQIKFNDKQETLGKLVDEIKAITSTKLSIEQIKNATLKNDSDKDTTIKALGIEFDKANAFTKATFSIESKNIDETDKNAKIVLAIKHNNETATAEFTLTKFGQAEENKNQKTLKAIVAKMNATQETPLASTKTSDQIRDIKSEDEASKNQDAKGLSSLLGITFDDKDVIVAGAQTPKYNFKSSNLSEQKVSVEIVVGDDSETADIKLVFAGQAPESKEIDKYVTSLKKDLLKQKESNMILQNLKEAFKNNANPANQNVDLEWLQNALGINLPKQEIPANAKLTFQVLNNGQVKSTDYQVQFEVVIKINDESLEKVTLNLSAIEQKKIDEYVQRLASTIMNIEKSQWSIDKLKNAFAKDENNIVNFEHLQSGLGISIENGKPPFQEAKTTFVVKNLGKVDKEDKVRFQITIRVNDLDKESVYINLSATTPIAK